MIRKRRRIACAAALAVLVTAVPWQGNANNTLLAASQGKKTKAYTLSKKPGTYKKTIRLKLKAKKGYKVYYSTNGNFVKKRVLKSGAVKKFTIKKTTTLSLYVTKSAVKKTAAQLKKKAVKKAAVQYVYKIKKAAKAQETNAVQETQTPSVSAGVIENDTTPTPVAVTQTAAAVTQAVETPPESATLQPQQTPPPIPSGMPQPPSGEPGGMPSGVPGENMPGADASASADPSGAQETLDGALSGSAAGVSPTSTTAPIVTDDTTPQLILTQSGVAKENLSEDSEAIKITEEDGIRTLTVKEAGTYILTGKTAEQPVKNTVITVAKGIEEPVNLVWEDLVIDNSELGNAENQDVPVFWVEKKTVQVTVMLVGNSSFTGNGSYTEEPASGVIYVKDADTTLTMMASPNDPDASLAIQDGMPADQDYGDHDPTDGIFAKGALVLQSGVYEVEVNGDCLKATGADGEGGVTIRDGEYTLTSHQGNGIRSKNGNVVIGGGKIKTLYTAEDGVNAKNYAVNMTGGELTIDQCYGDGIQGENVYISGTETTLNITTCFANAGVNYYNTSRGSGNYNTLTAGDTTKTEQVNVDTGSHKGIKAGTKACTYEYETVEEGSDRTAGTVYTKEASGGVVISGGHITIDTTNTGIKYNGGKGFGAGNGSGNLSAADNDGKYIIGSPDDGIHSNHTCVISDAEITIASADDGITAPTDLIIMNGSVIRITACYEGIEGGNITIGTESAKEKDPQISIYSNDDSINAASKSSVHYVYADEEEEVYTKTEHSASDNTLQVLSGYINIMIADDVTHSFSLPTEESGVTTGSYTGDGDGIDCNGSFYAYGGTLILYGPKSDGNAVIDTDSTFYVGSGVTLLAVGSSGMAQNPSTAKQAYVVYGKTSTGQGGMGGRPGNNNGNGNGSFASGTSAIGTDTPFTITDSDKTVLVTIKAQKEYAYVLYSSPTLQSGESYTMYTGGTVSELLNESMPYDFRYTTCDLSGASVLSTVTAG